MRIERIGGYAAMGLVAATLAACGCARRCRPAPCAPVVVAPRAVPAAPAAPAVRVPEIFVEASVLRVREDALRARSDAAGVAAGGHRVLDSAAADAFVAGFDGDEAKVVHAPRILALEGQEATLFVGESADESGLAFSVETSRWRGERMRVVATQATEIQVTLDVQAASRPDLASPALVAAAQADVPTGKSLVVVSKERDATGDRLAVVLRARRLGADDAKSDGD